MRSTPVKLFLRKGLFLIVALVGLLSIVVIATGCGADEPEANTTKPLTQTSVQLAWVHNIEFIGFYGATDQGYYTQENLEVTVLNGGFDENGAYIDPVEVVVNGSADFGVAGADILLQAREQGQPVVGVASIYQRSPIVLISLKEKNIVSPQDLLGKRVLLAPAATTVDVAYNALLASKNLARTDINEIPRTDFTVNPLFNGEADVLPGFITNEAVQAQLRDDISLILMSDYDIDIYSNVIFTTEDMIQNKPDLVRAFVQATIQGMQWAANNPENAAQHVINTYGEGMPQDVKDVQLPGMQASLPLFNPAGNQPGTMTASAWEKTHQILLDQGILEDSLDIDGAYTLSFLQLEN